ncbi:hypothetical protein IAT38_000924 [Cryptococcus sp. DSM 104549]
MLTTLIAQQLSEPENTPTTSVKSKANLLPDDDLAGSSQSPSKKPATSNSYAPETRCNKGRLSYPSTPESAWKAHADMT